MQAGERLIGLVADSAREFVSIPPDAIQPPNEALTGMSGRYVDGIASMGDRLVLVLESGSDSEFCRGPDRRPR